MCVRTRARAHAHVARARVRTHMSASFDPRLNGDIKTRHLGLVLMGTLRLDTKVERGRVNGLH